MSGKTTRSSDGVEAFVKTCAGMRLFRAVDVFVDRKREDEEGRISLPTVTDIFAMAQITMFFKYREMVRS